MKLRCVRHASRRVLSILSGCLCAGVLLTACVGEREDVPDTTGDDDTSVAADTSSDDTTADTFPTDTSMTTADDTADDTGSDATDADTSSTDTSMTTTDATMQDSTMSDADTSTEVTGPATVTVIGEDGVAVDLPVVSHRVDGTVYATAVTDSRGVATLDVVEGGWVTTDAAGVLGERILISVADVSVGDAIVLESVESSNDEFFGNLSATVDFANFPSIAHVTVANGCGSISGLETGAVAQLPLYESCAADVAAKSGVMIALGFDVDDQPVAYSLLTGVRAEDTPRFVSWTSPVDTFELTINNALGSRLAESLYTAVDIATVSVELPGEMVTFDKGSDTARIAVPRGPAGNVFPLDYHLVFDVDALTFVDLEVNTNLPFAGATIDAQSDMLPPFASATVDPGPRPIVTWEAGNRMSAADGMLALLTWPSAVGVRRWAVMFPPELGKAVLLPELPDTLASQGPGTVQDVEITMMATEASFYPGYDALRAEPIRAFSDIEGGPAEFTRARSIYNIID